jgi:tetrahydromethanopterin S-methyltransferase subunit F
MRRVDTRLLIVGLIVVFVVGLAVGFAVATLL